MVVTIKESLEKGNWGSLVYGDVKDFLKNSVRTLKFECFRKPEDQYDYNVHRKIMKSFNDWKVHDLINAKFFENTHRSWYFTRNGYPYEFKSPKGERVEHYLLWLNPKFQEVHIKNEKNIDNYHTNLCRDLTYQKFGSSNVLEIESLENPQHMRSVPAIRHYHVFIRLKN